MDRSELEAKIAEGQRAQQAMSELKALDAVTDEVSELREAIAKLEDEGRFNQALPLKVRLARMASRGGTP